jgi:cytochrome b involved in lipid metabolism
MSILTDDACTAFYFVDNAPAANNALENYYSTSLKTHRKKQLEVPGIEDQTKLSSLKRSGIFRRPSKTLLGAFLMFNPFLDRGKRRHR